MNIGRSSRLPYDECAYTDRLSESTSPLNYKLSPDQIYNCDNCLSVFGPRSSNNGRGNDVSRYMDTRYAPSQNMVDVESILSNRNMKNSKCKNGRVNPVNVMDYKLVNYRICNNTLNPEATRLSYPANNYRDLSQNRFHNLPRDPQENIFWNFSINSQLEAIDNIKPVVPTPISDKSLPKSNKDEYTTYDPSKGLAKYTCPSDWKSKK